jgi:glycerophosphoryl diester phosphodiesterase
MTDRSTRGPWEEPEAHGPGSKAGEAQALGFQVGAPPWILGHRGVPHEAPENTLAGMRRALELGLDGFEYDLRACASGEAVLMHDETLTRTTNSHALLSKTQLPELFGVDAGSWFGKRFVGEPVPLFDEALELSADQPGPAPLHMIELKETGLVQEVLAKLEQIHPRPAVRVASFLPEVVIEAQQAGLPAMLLADRASEDDRLLCRRNGITAYGVGPGGWDGAGPEESAGKSWAGCELWGWSLDDPDEILRACRLPLAGFNTNQPQRARVIRALARWTPDDSGPYPLVCPELIVEPESLPAEVRARGEWYGEWSVRIGLRNPFPFGVQVRCSLFFPSGAFQCEGLPRVVDLQVDEERQLDVQLKGGARSPGPDPLLGALFRSSSPLPENAALPPAGLLLDAPLVRRRVTVADPLARRLSLLRESAGERGASLTLRRTGHRVRLTLEHPGALQDAHLIASLDGRTERGGRTLDLLLPEHFDHSPRGTLFTCGIEGGREGRPHLLRWAGGLPGGVGHGAAGRLLPLTISR